MIRPFLAILALFALAPGCPKATSNVAEGAAPAPDPAHTSEKGDRALADKIARLMVVEKKMRASLAELKENQGAAEALEKSVQALAATHGQAKVDAAIKTIQARGRIPADPALKKLEALGRELDRELPELLEEVPARPEDAPTTNKLKNELQARQIEARNLARATQVAFRAMALVSQMKGLLPLLQAELADAKKGEE